MLKHLLESKNKSVLTSYKYKIINPTRNFANSYVVLTSYDLLSHEVVFNFQFTLHFISTS